MRLISISAIYIILQGFILTVCAAPVNNYSDVNTTSTNTLQNSTALEELKGQGLSNSVTPSDPSQDTSSPPATSTSSREERRSIKEKVHNALEALKGNAPNSGSSNPSPDSSPDTSSSATPPERRSRSRYENGRSIMEKLTHVVEALKGQGSSAVASSTPPDPTQSSSPAKRSFSDGKESRSIKEKLSNALAALKGQTPSSGDNSTSTASEPSDTSSPSPTRRSLSRRLMLAVAVTVSEGEALTPFVSPSQIAVRDVIRELLEAAAPSLALGTHWRLDWENIPSPKADAKSRIEFSMTGPEKCGGTCTAWVEEKKHEIKDHSGKVIYP
ncbi:hypothetical protein C8R41DRAFT_917420 [Lentinula lateritia]|uniref:Uncharacterized protein n=1 Tax=Lentinula lateritia TaxID=40482 RepID=A0ABQ8VLV1_9AGAR|nr:hypothetical protein C8R41DRAFT_917420 [Lentinula lateritia]